MRNREENHKRSKGRGVESGVVIMSSVCITLIGNNFVTSKKSCQGDSKINNRSEAQRCHCWILIESRMCIN